MYLWRFPSVCARILVEVFQLVEMAVRRFRPSNECYDAAPGSDKVRYVVHHQWGLIVASPWNVFLTTRQNRNGRRKKTNDKCIDLCIFSGFLGLDPGVVNYVGACYMRATLDLNTKSNYTLKTSTFKQDECKERAWKVDAKKSSANARCWIMEKTIKCRKNAVWIMLTVWRIRFTDSFITNGRIWRTYLFETPNRQIVVVRQNVQTRSAEDRRPVGQI